MSRHALNGISQVIKANTTEKSIDDLRAEGKKRVRVVSSDRVMAIIQAIVDDTINSEVGEITKRDRDRIVSDTQDRFSRVLKMQQDLEQDVDDLRGSLRDAELERDRLRGEKVLLESQIAATRRTDGEEDGVARLARDVARMRDVVERTAREPGAIDEAALGRVVEKLSARDTQNARRLAAELEDLRTRLDVALREAAATRESASEKLVQRLNVRLCESDAHVEERLERGFREVADHVAELRGQIGRAPAAEDAVARLRSDFDALESRIQGRAKSSSDDAERVAKAVTDWLQQRDAAEAGRRKTDAAAEAGLSTESLRRVQRACDETRESILQELAILRESADHARARPAIIEAEQVTDIEQRVTAVVTESTGALARAIDRIAERMATLDRSLDAMRGDTGVTEATAELAKVVDRIAERVASLDRSLEAMRGDTGVTEATAELAKVVDRVAERLASIDGSLETMRSDVGASEATAELAKVVDRVAERVATIDRSLAEMRSDAGVSEATAELAKVVDRVAERVATIDRSLDAMRSDVGASEATAGLAKVVHQVAERVATIDRSLAEMRSDVGVTVATAELAKVVDRLAERVATIDGSLEAMRQDVAAAIDRASAGSAAAAQAEGNARLDGALAELRSEFSALTSRGAEAAERQEQAIRSLSDRLALSASVQSGSLESTFKGALEQALDKITRTMERATARPIEMTGEATDVLLAKMFDVPDGEMTSNLDQLDVDQRHSNATIASSVGRLKEMSGRAKPATK